MLKEFAPSLQRAAFLGNPKTTAFDYLLDGAKTVAPSLGVELVPARVESADDMLATIEGFARIPNGGLVFRQMPLQQGGVISSLDWPPAINCRRSTATVSLSGGCQERCVRRFL
jgi:hypothetical protein